MTDFPLMDLVSCRQITKVRMLRTVRLIRALRGMRIDCVCVCFVSHFAVMHKALPRPRLHQVPVKPNYGLLQPLVNLSEGYGTVMP